MIKAFKEANAVSVDESPLFGDVASFCENMADGNCAVLIVALVGYQKLNDFKSIINLRSKPEIIDLLNAVSDFHLGENANFINRKKKDLPSDAIYIVGKKTSCFI